MNDFMQQSNTPQPFAMEQMRHDLPNVQQMARRTPSPGWAQEFDPGQQVNMEAAFANSRMSNQRPSSFQTKDFAQFQHSSQSNTQRTSTPVAQTSSYMNQYQQPMGMGYSGMGMGMGMQSSYMPMQQQQQPEAMGKGKGKLVELDDTKWEEQFAEMDQDNVSEEANQAMERELERSTG